MVSCVSTYYKNNSWNNSLKPMKVIFAGLESSGKSLKLAMIVVDLAYRNSKWLKKQEKDKAEMQPVDYFKKYGRLEIKPRPIISNLKFSEGFFDYVTKELRIPIIYWEKLEELIEYEQGDVIWDEVGNYLDATKWALLSSDVKKWLTQGAKVGIEIYGSSQDFAQVDKSFRRLTNHLFQVTKLAGSRRPSSTKPPVKFIWGLCWVREMNPRTYREDNKEIKGSLFDFGNFFVIERKYCEIFDTTQKIKKENTLFLRHLQVKCSDPNCTFHAVKHV